MFILRKPPDTYTWYSLKIYLVQLNSEIAIFMLIFSNNGPTSTIFVDCVK